MNVTNLCGISDRGLRNAAGLRSEKLGAWFEQETQDRLKWLKLNRGVTFLRLYDTKSAGAYLPAQPGDFMVGSLNDVYLVECKASVRSKSLKGCLSSNTSKSQAVEHFMWHRAGHRSVFIFISMSDGMVELWNGKYVADHRREGRRMSDEGLLKKLPASEYHLLLLQLFLTSLGAWKL